MLIETTILRLIISQVFGVYFLLILIPLKEPIKRNAIILILGGIIITTINALVIIYLGLSPFYIRYYFLTLLIPYIILLSSIAYYKGSKLIFAILSTQVIGNVAIINGLFASYFFYGENNPLIDTLARSVTYLIFLPIIFKLIQPTYLKMVTLLNKGWWILNSALILAYALAYYILFVPVAIFSRPEYFVHAYIGIILSLSIYVIIFFLFIEIQSKMDVERDKQHLFTQVRSLTEQSEAITTIAYKDALTGVNNRYSLFRKMDQLILNNQPFLVVFIDLDNLKEINDTYDHTKGDTYLKQFALSVENIVKDQGSVYRFAGDEFVCLIVRDFTQFNSHHFKSSIIKDIVIDIPFLGLSLGLAHYPKDGLNSDDLISFADQAMYTEKRTKKIRR